MKHKYLPLNQNGRLAKISDIPQPPLYVPKGGSLFPVQDLLNLFGPIEDQGQYGSCSAFSSLQWYAAWQVKQGKPWQEYSEMGQYVVEREIDGTVNQDAGARMLDAVSVLCEKGVIPEGKDPYVPQDFQTIPPDSAYIPGSQLPANLVKTIDERNVLAHSLDALSHGYPVLIGFIVYPELESQQVAQTGVLTMPSANEQPLGGHGVVAVGYDQNTQMVKIRNQWGANWGQLGYFQMPFAYYSQYVDEAYIIEFD